MIRPVMERADEYGEACYACSGNNPREEGGDALLLLLTPLLPGC